MADWPVSPSLPSSVGDPFLGFFTRVLAIELRLHFTGWTVSFQLLDEVLKDHFGIYLALVDSASSFFAAHEIIRSCLRNEHTIVGHFKFPCQVDAFLFTGKFSAMCRSGQGVVVRGHHCRC